VTTGSTGRICQCGVNQVANPPAALRSERSSGDVFTAFGGPLIGAGADILRLAAAPIREEFDETQNVRTRTAGDLGAAVTEPKTRPSRGAHSIG